jgi:hypothetical protein
MNTYSELLRNAQEQMQTMCNELSENAAEKALAELVNSWVSASFDKKNIEAMIDDIDGTIGHLIDFRNRLSHASTNDISKFSEPMHNTCYTKEIIREFSREYLKANN